MTLRPKTEPELDAMREGGQKLSRILEATDRFIRIGQSLKEIDTFINKRITEAGGTPSFLGYRGFPASSCLSVNAVVVHGIPSDYVLQDGDILGVDIGFYFDGYHTDAAFTKPLGTVAPKTLELLHVTQQALKDGIEAAVAGTTVGDLGADIEASITSHGTYGIIRDLAGHGIGKNLQELPEILNYGHKNKLELINNLTLAIEPMVATGDWHVVLEDDNWTVTTRDNSPCAHFETTLIVRDADPEVLVSFPVSYEIR